MVVIVLPSFHFLSRIVQSNELVDVEKLIPQPSVERFDQPIVSGFSGPRVVELDASPVGPLVQGFGCELRAIVHGDRLGLATQGTNLVKRLSHAPA